MTVLLLATTIACAFWINHLRLTHITQTLGHYSDLNLFVEAGNRFHQSGTLYIRQFGDATLTLAEVYQPSSPVFKFPPAFQLQLLPLRSALPPAVFYKYAQFMMMLLYLFACILVMREVLYEQKNYFSMNTFAFMMSAAITAITSDAYGYALYLLNYEIPILFLLLLSFLLSARKPLVSGAIVGYLAAVKIYPAFMLMYFLMTRSRRGIAGFFVSAASFTLLGIAAFGLRENLFYFQEILPILTAESVSDAHYNTNIANLLAGLAGNHIDRNLSFAITRWSFAVASLILLATRSSHWSAPRLEVFALLMTLMLICLPNCWQSYQILLFPALAIALHKACNKPHIVKTPLMLLAIASLATDTMAWVSFWPVPGLTPADMTADSWNERMLGAIIAHNSIHAGLLSLFHEHPLNVILYYLAAMRSAIPAALWLILAHDIFASPARPTSRS